jgi:hypothetical protein
MPPLQMAARVMGPIPGAAGGGFNYDSKPDCRCWGWAGGIPN